MTSGVRGWSGIKKDRKFFFKFIYTLALAHSWVGYRHCKWEYEVWTLPWGWFQVPVLANSLLIPDANVSCRQCIICGAQMTPFPLTLVHRALCRWSLLLLGAFNSGEQCIYPTCWWLVFIICSFYTKSLSDADAFLQKVWMKWIEPAYAITQQRSFRIRCSHVIPTDRNNFLRAETEPWEVIFVIWWLINTTALTNMYIPGHLLLNHFCHWNGNFMGHSWKIPLNRVL